ncbi:MAG: AbrB/MazE/SpoVT family DNA-binding domain-containing protein, partial [Thermodesulfobacteriota bacterium]
EGKTAKEIMKELGIARYTLNEHLLMLQREDKKIYHIDGLFDYTDEKRQRNKVRKNDGIVIPPSLIEKSALNPGDKYEILVEKGHVVLKKVEDDE